jgi:hypothetical protein
MSATLQLRTAAILLWTTAVGFGWFCIPAINNVRSGREIPRAFGFPAYGEGPFERHGIPSTVPLLTGFLIVCVAEAVAGWLVWGGHKSGAILALVLLPIGAVFWWGFALPIPPILALVRTALIVVAWRALA